MGVLGFEGSQQVIESSLHEISFDSGLADFASAWFAS